MSADLISQNLVAAQLSGQSSLQSTAHARSSAANGQLENEAARAAAEDFESIFLATMMSPMFEGTQAAEPFGGGFAEETWQGLLIEEYGKTIAAAGGVGVSDAVYRELTALQEKFYASV